MASTPKNKFTDIDLNFAKNPLTRDVNILQDETAIKRSLKNIILTNIYERPFLPELKGNVTAMLFEPFTDLTVIRIEKGIRDAIMSYEPRVVIQDIIVEGEPDRNRFIVTIRFQIRNTSKVSETQFYLERLR
jgi:phage baseplate assembly protein W